MQVPSSFNTKVPSSFNTKEVFIMSTIRKEYNPTGDISKNLDEILRKNGMEAHLKEVGDSYQLLVMSHDSPEVSYNISKTDALKMMNGGSHASDKKAYNTFVSIVRNDFYVPNNFVHAHGHTAIGYAAFGKESETGPDGLSAS